MVSSKRTKSENFVRTERGYVSPSISSSSPLAPEAQAVRKLFTEAQRTAQCHQRCCIALHRLMMKQPSSRDEFFACLSQLLVVFKREPAVERLVQFVSLTVKVGMRTDNQFTREERDEVPFLVVRFLLQKTSAADKAVRFRSCQLVGQILTGLMNAPEPLLDEMTKRILPRLRDKIPVVRVQAVKVLEFLQSQEAVVEDLVRALQSDSSPDVRKAVLESIEVNQNRTLPQVVRRVRDVKEGVRRAAFEKLRKVNVEYLSLEQRITLVSQGFADRSDEVKAACLAMVCTSWLGSTGNDPVSLLSLLDVTNNE
ncbi:unnamed protein product, partial [Choristocarpus tenellus]